MNISISISEEELKILKKRAKKNLLSLREQIEDIIRRSCVNLKKISSHEPKTDDRLIDIFSRQKRGRKRKRMD